MRENCKSGSVRGARGNPCPYRDRWVLGCAGEGAQTVYVLLHVRSGLLVAVPHAWGPLREQTAGQLACCTRLVPEAAAWIGAEGVHFDRQAVLLPEPVCRRIERALDAMDQSAYLE